ncbi:uncharacterized protein LOC113294817 [Papaver somniferum]|uniref:uncharacterized protein LOC113294817 n=1 Tax=Papaver somniferum TaxID=3469 RepID=UPI000E7021A1|nr:uncharacterized protein LOC113294817 [Papaver somniferum]
MENYYLHPEETEPHRTCQSKRYITKLMFLAAVNRPRFDEFRNEIFDGKLSIFPFITKEAAKRTSKNRPAGTLEDKPITVNTDVVRDCLIEKLLPAIREKWQNYNGETIYIQQDNAKPHIKLNDEKFLREAAKDGFDIRLRFQPSQIPDMNVLDLGFFMSIQSLQHQEAPTTVAELLLAVNKAFNELNSQTLNDVFLSLQLCMVEVIKIRDGNNYKLKHMGKKRLARIGELPKQIEIFLQR